MKLLLDNKDEYALFKTMAAQGKTDPEICDAFLQSHRQFSQEIMIHCDLPDEKEIDSLSCPIWTDEEQDAPFEVSTPLDNFSPTEKSILTGVQSFLNEYNYAFVTRTADPAGPIFNFCKLPDLTIPAHSEKQEAINSFMENHGITEIRPTKTGLKIWYEGNSIENVSFLTWANLNYPFYQEEEEGAVLA